MLGVLRKREAIRCFPEHLEKNIRHVIFNPRKKTHGTIRWTLRKREDISCTYLFFFGGVGGGKNTWSCSLLNSEDRSHIPLGLGFSETEKSYRVPNTAFWKEAHMYFSIAIFERRRHRLSNHRIRNRRHRSLGTPLRTEKTYVLPNKALRTEKTCIVVKLASRTEKELLGIDREESRASGGKNLYLRSAKRSAKIGCLRGDEPMHRAEIAL
jgi:hypothetical protein